MPPNRRSGPKVAAPQGRRHVEHPGQETDFPHGTPRHACGDGNGCGPEAMRTLLLAAAELADDLTGRAEADAAAFAQAYELGYHSGWQVGYWYARTEDEDAARRVAAHVRGIADRPSFAELTRRRNGADRPRPDYPGGPVEWDTGRPLRPEGGAA
jgi:hypothetical protein